MLTSKRRSRVEAASHLSPLSRPLFKHHAPFDRQLVPVPHARINTVLLTALPDCRARVADHWRLGALSRSGAPQESNNSGEAGLRPVVSTVGHSTRSLAEFIVLLGAHSVNRTAVNV